MNIKKQASGIKCVWCSLPVLSVLGEQELRGYVMHIEGVSTPQGHYHTRCLKLYQEHLKGSEFKGN